MSGTEDFGGSWMAMVIRSRCRGDSECSNELAVMAFVLNSWFSS